MTENMYIYCLTSDLMKDIVNIGYTNDCKKLYEMVENSGGTFKLEILKKIQNQEAIEKYKQILIDKQYARISLEGDLYNLSKSDVSQIFESVENNPSYISEEDDDLFMNLSDDYIDTSTFMEIGTYLYERDNLFNST